MILNHLGRSWQKHKNLIPKLKHLQTHNKIQEALKVIIVFSQYELQRASPLDKRIFENEYFKESPFNYFLPFYENNPSIDNIYDEDNDGIDDLEGYIKFLYNSPLPDAFKYLMCNSAVINKNKNKSEKDNDSDENIKEYIRHVLNIHSVFNPYLNYASEIINFYENNPLAKNTINQKTSIVTFNGLKNILLNTVEHHRALARQFAVQEQWGEAITNYEQLLDIEENDISALSNLVACLENTKKSIDYLLKLRLRIEKLQSKDHENLYKIGRLYDKKKKYKTAIKYFNKAIILDDENAYYFSARASVNRLLKKLEDSLLDHNKSIEFDRKNTIYFNNRGNTKFELEDYEGALRDYDEAIRLDDKVADPYSNRARVKDQLKHYDGAIRDYDEAIKLNEKEATYFNNRGGVKLSMKKHKEALKDYNKAISLNNKEAIYFSNRGNVKCDLKDYEGALKDFDKAIFLDKKDITIYANKANLFRRLNQIEKAFEIIYIAQKLDAKNAEVYGTKAAIYSSKGDEEKFYELLEKAIQLKVDLNNLDDDIKEKYKDEKRFQELLKKYDQTLDE